MAMLASGAHKAIAAAQFVAHCRAKLWHRCRSVDRYGIKCRLITALPIDLALRLFAGPYAAQIMQQRVNRRLVASDA